MTEREVQDFIKIHTVRGSVLGLEAVRELARRMGNPENDLKIIHIAGTNGKGSILAYVSTILKENGYKVGRYLSPVIHEYREKIQVNEKMISRKSLAEGLTLIKECMDEMQSENMNLPTIFEIETVLALWYFKKKGCDFVVLETGMGGETDATNIVNHPLLCIFASISMDHMAFLGNSLAEITSVKSGIMRPDTVALSVTQKSEVENILKHKAGELGCKLVFADKCDKIKYGLETQVFDYQNYKKCKIHLSGVWQIENAAVSIAAVKELKALGYKISDEAIYKGLANTNWGGRFTVLNKKPLFIMDGAHNEDASIRLRESILTYLSEKPLIFIMGVLKDKEYEKVLANTADLAAHIITVTPPENTRALSAYDLAQAAQKYCSRVTNADSIEEAVELASLLAGQECDIIAFGSLSYLSRLEEAVNIHFSKKKKGHK